MVYRVYYGTMCLLPDAKLPWTVHLRLLIAPNNIHYANEFQNNQRVVDLIERQSGAHQTTKWCLCICPTHWQKNDRELRDNFRQIASAVGLRWRRVRAHAVFRDLPGDARNTSRFVIIRFSTVNRRRQFFLNYLSVEGELLASCVRHKYTNKNNKTINAFYHQTTNCVNSIFIIII